MLFPTRGGKARVLPLSLTLNILKGDKTDSVSRDERETVRSSTCTWTAGGDKEQDRVTFTQKTTDLPNKKKHHNQQPVFRDGFFLSS